MTRLLPPLVTCLAACVASPTAPHTGDTGISTSQPTPPQAGPVQLRLQGFLQGQGVAYVHDVDGSYLHQVAIDAAGYAELRDVPPGGMVTVAKPLVEATQLATVRDVHPGQELVLGIAYDAPPWLLEVSYDATSIPGAAGVQVNAGCGGDRGSAIDTSTFEIERECRSERTLVAAVATDEDDVPLAYAVRTLEAEFDATSVTFDADDWQTDFGTLRLQATSAPKEAEVGLAVLPMRGPGLLQQVDQHAHMTPGGALLTSTPIVPAADQLLGFLEFWGGSHDLRLSTFPIDVLPEPGDEVTAQVDIGALLLPAIDPAQVTLDEASATVHGEPRCAAGAADLELWRWGRRHSGTFHSWDVAQRPGEHTEVVLPDLGPDADLWWPTDGDDQGVDVMLVAHETLDFEQLRGPLLDRRSAQSWLYRPLGPALCVSFSSAN
ncbi:MAG: hypothetical protein KTR31_41400 [Myxococcales bacterium]|nr:hypothetical protein [Myxococcales bacterium]